jgi:hypothetical protein
MSKRPNSDQPTTVKRVRKASGFRLARSVFTDPVQSTPASGSSRFVTLSENPAKRGSLRTQNRLLPGPSKLSESHSNGSEPQVSEPDLGLEGAAQHEEVLPDSSESSHTKQGKRKRKRHNKTYVSDYSNYFFVYLR